MWELNVIGSVNGSWSLNVIKQSGWVSESIKTLKRGHRTNNQENVYVIHFYMRWDVDDSITNGMGHDILHHWGGVSSCHHSIPFWHEHLPPLYFTPTIFRYVCMYVWWTIVSCHVDIHLNFPPIKYNHIIVPNVFVFDSNWIFRFTLKFETFYKGHCILILVTPTRTRHKTTSAAVATSVGTHFRILRWPPIPS